MNSLTALGSSVGPVVSKPGKALSHLDGSIGWTGAANAPNLLNTQALAGASFASLFAGATAAPAAANDSLAQLTSLIQRGTPLSAIVDRLAQQIATAVQQKLPAQATAGGRLGGTLAKSIANALAPPGNAPPGTASDQVAALATRLQQWIAAIAGESNSQAGQQNDIAGKLLDANSAKDIPAQCKRETTASNDNDAAALARALLNSLASALAPAPAVTSPVPTAPVNAPTPASAQVAAPQLAATPQITMANAPDLLARMILRAAGVDARVNGAGTQSGQTLASGGTDSTPTALVARFTTALNAQSAGFGGNFSQQRDAKSPAQDAPPNVAVAASSPAPAQFVVSPQTAASRPLVDPNAVVEQVVKSLMMRTTQAGTSEIHLHLSPEHLGEVMMKITVTGSSISANVVAQNGEVRNALLANQQQLVRSLSDAGMTLSGFSVDVSGGDSKRDSSKDRTDGFGRRYVVHELSGPSGETESPQLSSLGPQLLPNSSLDLFNYLA
ncbi:MAG: flagellar hook-length control protein FliK [Candidatus Eremiobacteraeota bacterium]|nr:flagellar hook-length control protein FliK [Candidatus Eremiobacteraeota bacterium]